MKRTDIALIILIVSVSAVIAYFAGKALIGEPKVSATQVESVELIKPGIQAPSKNIFNSQAINPTVPIQIGNPSNQQPFTGTSQ
jgi:hypothetical protein